MIKIWILAIALFLVLIFFLAPYPWIYEKEIWHKNVATLANKIGILAGRNFIQSRLYI